MARPGVYVSEAPLERVVNTAVSTETYGAFIGTALRGPTVPTRVDSWSDFVALFGGIARSKTLPTALYQFFLNSKSAAYVCRVLASDAVAATMTFNDSDKDRLVVTAKTKGIWGNGLYYQVGDLNDTNHTFSFTVSDTVRGERVVVERFKNLTMTIDDPRYILAIVNSETIGSRYVSLTDILKDNAPLEGGVSITQLINGVDGAAAITDGDYSAAFDQFDAIDAMFVVNVPGRSSVGTIVAKAESRGDSVVIIDTPENQAPDMDGIALPTLSYGAMYYPWMYIADPSPDAPRGSVLKVPPGASVAGVILATDASRGVFKAPAGSSARIQGAVNVEQVFSNADLDRLADSHVNVLRPLSGIGIAIMGARTGSSDIAQYLSIRRTLNLVKKKSALISRSALFEPNTPALWDQLRVANGSFLGELWVAGGLAGGRPDQAYYVKCDETNNTPQTIANGEVHVEIGVAPVFPAEFVSIRVAYFESDSSVVISEEGLL